MADAPNRRLDGWKAVADFLGRDVRTVQRWNRQRGLPVYRVPGGKSGTIFGYTLELESWLREPASAHCDDSLDQKASAAGPQQRSAGAESPALDQANDPRRNAASNSRLWQTGRPFRWTAVASIALLLTAGGLIVGSIGRALSTNSPAEIVVDGNELVALDAEHHQLWTYAVIEGGTAGGMAPTLQSVVPADLDGDRDNEWIALVGLREPGKPGRPRPGSDAIYSFSAGGRLLWTYRPQERLKFGDRLFAEPFIIRTWGVAARPRQRFWATLIHQTWWPSYAVSIGAGNDVRLEFVNSGHLEAFGTASVDSHAYVLLGGVNNEYRSAALAVLDQEVLPAASPQTAGSPFACTSCPSGQPFRYVLFPRSEVSVAFGEPYNFAAIITTAADGGRIEVSVKESGELRSVYRFSDELMPETIAMSDRYWQAHQDLFQRGTLDHPAERCNERTHGVNVRVWEPAAGWKDVHVPPTFAPEQAVR